MNIKAEIGNRIRSARKKTKLSIVELADKLNFTVTRVGNWERGMRTPKLNEVLKLAEILNVEPSYLFCFSDAEKDNAELRTSLTNKVIPILSFDDAANYHEILEKGKLELLKSGEHLLADTHLNSKLFALKIEDDSMSPEFKPNDIIIIAPNLKVLPGKYVLAKMANNNRVVFRKLRQISAEDSDVYQMAALNNDWPTITLDFAKGDQILGVLLEHRRRYHLES